MQPIKKCMYLMLKKQWKHALYIRHNIATLCNLCVMTAKWLTNISCVLSGYAESRHIARSGHYKYSDHLQIWNVN